MARQRRARLASSLTLVKDLSDASFTAFLQALAKQKPKDGVEGIAELSRQQLTNVCTALEGAVQRGLDGRGSAEGEPDAEDGASEQVQQDAIDALHGAALLALELLTRSGQDPPQPLLTAACTLHDNLLLAPLESEGGTAISEAVLRLCMAWYERRAPSYDALLAQVIPYMLIRATRSIERERGRAAMVHMCYAMREALELLDYEDESITDTKRLLLQAAMHPNFLRCPEGRRFIAFLFRLHPDMVHELFAIARNQIASGQRATLEAYGEILFRAWRDTAGACAADVEEELQGLMQAAILASTPALAAALRTVLNALHSQRHLDRRLDSALVRLYDPILPRAFGAANAEVRRNALQLLVAAFPLIEPGAPADENNSRLARQLSLMLDCLADPCPAVREAAVGGSCQVLNLFWEIIPAATAARFVGDITGKLAFDASSRAVRIAVLHGLRLLLDNQHAQPVLKRALPGLSVLLHDTDPGVREGLMDLLVGLSGNRGLGFWDVVPAEALLGAVAGEGQPAGVSHKVAQVLVPAYFPNALQGPLLVAALLRSQPAAGAALCRHLVARFRPAAPNSTTTASKGSASDYSFSGTVPTEQVVQLFAALVSHLAATAPGLRGSAAAAAPDQSPAPKRAKPAGAKRGKGGKAAAGAGKKRAKKGAPEAANDGEGEEGTNGRAQAASGGDEEDVVLQDAATESVEDWVSILEGVVALAEGLGAAADAAAESEEGGEVYIADMEAALGSDGLEEILRGAEEGARGSRAMRLALRVTASLHATANAKRVRASLFARLARGALPGMAVNAAGEAATEDAALAADALKALATGSNGPKLAAMLAAALGVREAQPLRKPVAPKKAGKSTKGGAGSAEEEALLAALGVGARADDDTDCHDILCAGCGCSEPEDTMLLCDGCDMGCHMHCLRPVLEEVPQSDWFCWACEAQLQQEVELDAATAGRCVGLLLAMEEGRHLLCGGHTDVQAMLEAMRHLAINEAEEIATLAAGSTAGEADSARPPAPGDAGADEGAEAWGALARYCRAALHYAMHTLYERPQPSCEDAGEGAAAPSAARTPYRTPGSAARGRRGVGRLDEKTAAAAREDDDGGDNEDAADANGPDATAVFGTLMGALEFGLHTCNQLAAVVMDQPGAAPRVAALQYALGVLRVVHVAHEADLLAISADHTAHVCGLCSRMTALVAATLPTVGEQASGHGGGAAAAHGTAFVASVLEVVLGLARQMAAALRRATAAGGGAVTPTPGGHRRASADGGGGGGDCDGNDQGFDADAQPSASQQQLQRRLHAAADGGPDEEAAAPQDGASLDALALQLVRVLAQPAAAPMLRGAVRACVADLVGELLVTSQRVAKGRWLAALCALAGKALTGDPAVADLLLRRQEGANAADDGGVREDAPRSGGSSPANDENAPHSPDGTMGGDAPPGGDTAVRGATRATGGSRARGAGEAPAGGGPGKAGEFAAVARMAEALQRSNPALGTLATVLVRVCVARKAHGRAMLLLADIASGDLSRASLARRDSMNSGSSSGEEGEASGGALAGSKALGALALLRCCQAAAADADAVAAAPSVARRKPGGRCGALAQQAAAHAASAEAAAAARAVEVLRRAVDASRVLRPLEAGEQPCAASLARSLAEGLAVGVA